MTKRSLWPVLITTLAAVALLPVCSCFGVATGSGPVVTRDFNIIDFTGIEASNAFEIEITQSSAYKVSVSANENLFDYMDVSKSGSTLKIGMKRTIIPGSATLKAQVSLPELWSLDLSGATRGTASGLSSNHDFSSQISGASTLNMDMQTGNAKLVVSGASKVTGHLKAFNIIFDISGASRVDMDGAGDNGTLSASGASQINIPGLPLKDTSVNLSSASHGDITVNGRLDADVSSASSLVYSGNPTLGNISITGASSFKSK